MAISNTNILIKRSSTTATPSSLKSGELAYSYSSNNVFIGTVDGSGALPIGGYNTYTAVNNATSANTADTIVKRDGNNAFYGLLYGTSNTANKLSNSQNFSISGGDISASSVSFDGTGAVQLNASLNTVSGLSAGYYGGSTASSSTIPVVQVAANGRIMSISNTTVTSSFTISDGSSSVQFESGNTLFQLGTKGIVAAVSQNTVTFSTDDTVLRSNTTSVGPQVISTRLTVGNDVSITGNLTVTGNTSTIHTVDYVVDDPMIYLAGNNYTSDVVSIGFAGNYYDGSDERHTGLYRAPDTKQYYLFDNYLPELSGNNQVDRSNTSFHIATLTANLDSSGISSSQITNSTITGGSISGLASDLSVTDGGTGVSSFNIGEILIGNGTSGLSQLANVSSINTSIASNSTVNNLTTDVYGRVTNYTTQAIGGLTVAQGGTGVSSFTNGQLLIGNGTDALVSLANTGSAGTYGDGATVPVITTDVYGRVSNVTNTTISIGASQISSGTLPIVRGGTNNTSFTDNQITYFNGTSIVSLANSSFTATGTGASNSTVTSVTVDGFGRATALTYTAISGLTVPQGGTGLSSITSNGITYGNGDGALGVTPSAGVSDQGWSNQILTVTNAGVPVWSTAMDGGTF